MIILTKDFNGHSSVGGQWVVDLSDVSVIVHVEVDVGAICDATLNASTVVRLGR